MLILFCFKAELPAPNLHLGVEVLNVPSKPLLSLRQTFSSYSCLLYASSKLLWFIKLLNVVCMPFPHNFHSLNSSFPLVSICSLLWSEATSTKKKMSPYTHEAISQSLKM